MNKNEEQSKMEIRNLSDKKFKVRIIKMFSELRRRMDEHSEKINKELGNIKKNQTEMKNAITEIKSALNATAD